MSSKSVTLAETVEFINSRDNFTVLCHTNPDGDTLGSGYALCGVLHLIGKRARLICDEKPSARFEFLKETIRDKPEMQVFVEGVDETIVTVDVADVELLGSLKETYANKIDLSIDHHISNKKYATFTLLDTGAAACAELMWELIMQMESNLGQDWPPLVTTPIAAAIYTGIATDTGCFKYPNTTTISHMFAAEVMGYGFDAAKINYTMFEMKTRARIQLEQQAISSMEFYFGEKCALIVLDFELLEGIDPEDAGNVSSLPRQVEGVVVGVVLKEKSKGLWKASVRTGEGANAQAVCDALGGGGHLRAAGCTLTGDVESVKKVILAEVEKQLG